MSKVLIAGCEKILSFFIVIFFLIIYFPKISPSIFSQIASDLQAVSYPFTAVKTMQPVAPPSPQNIVTRPAHDTGVFKDAVVFTLKHEGGLVDDKADTGGITNYGISYTFLHSLVAKDPAIVSQLSLPNIAGGVTPSTIKDLTKQQAVQIYYTQWWEKYHFDSINDQAIAIKSFDYAVNMGSTPAIKLLQTACDSVADASVVAVNGQLDNSTVAYINSLDPTKQNQVLSAYEQGACNYYCDIAKVHPSDKKFLSGWLHRASDNNYLLA